MICRGTDNPIFPGTTGNHRSAWPLPRGGNAGAQALPVPGAPPSAAFSTVNPTCWQRIASAGAHRGSSSAPMGTDNGNYELRVATPADEPTLRALIARSIRALGAADYSPEQI